jgi:hypothetical protein
VYCNGPEPHLKCNCNLDKQEAEFAPLFTPEVVRRKCQVKQANVERGALYGFRLAADLTRLADKVVSP